MIRPRTISTTAKMQTRPPATRLTMRSVFSLIRRKRASSQVTRVQYRNSPRPTIGIRIQIGVRDIPPPRWKPVSRASIVASAAGLDRVLVKACRVQDLPDTCRLSAGSDRETSRKHIPTPIRPMMAPPTNRKTPSWSRTNRLISSRVSRPTPA